MVLFRGLPMFGVKIKMFKVVSPLKNPVFDLQELCLRKQLNLRFKDERKFRSQ